MRQPGRGPRRASTLTVRSSGVLYEAVLSQQGHEAVQVAARRVAVHFEFSDEGIEEVVLVLDAEARPDEGPRLVQADGPPVVEVEEDRLARDDLPRDSRIDSEHGHSAQVKGRVVGAAERVG